VQCWRLQRRAGLQLGVALGLLGRLGQRVGGATCQTGCPQCCRVVDARGPFEGQQSASLALSGQTLCVGYVARADTAHGGANEAALNMLQEIGTVDRIPEFIKRAKDKNDPFRLMGFGHRVYKNYDPRARVMQQTCHEVLNVLGIKDDPLLDVALELEKIALNDEYFVEKKLYPNIDFYSGITLKAMGFPTTMFTVLFALARTVGWVAQWNEMIEDPGQRIGRPRQLYTGAPRRDYVDIGKRK